MRILRCFAPALAGILCIVLTSAILHGQQASPAQASPMTPAPDQGPGISTLTTPGIDPALTRPVDQLTPAQIAGMQKKLADWPQLGRYSKDNAALGDPRPGEARVVFYGDSITDNWGRTYGKFFPDQPWINRGISGQTTPQMLARFSQDVLALHPKAVVILAGINDIFGNTGVETLPTIEDNIRAMVTLAKAAHVSVVLSSVMPALRFRLRPGMDPREEIVQLNTWLQQFSKEQNLVYLDYYSALVGPDGGMKPELVRDGLHPANEGYAVMEPLARAAVAKVLSRPGKRIPLK